MADNQARQQREQTSATLQHTLEVFKRLAETSEAAGWTDQASHVRRLIASLEGRLSVAPGQAQPVLDDAGARTEPDMPALRMPPERAGPVPPLPGGMERLTPRQRDVALLVAAGASNAEIAQRLVLSQGSVANYVAATLGRLGLSNRAQLAAWVTEHRAVDDLRPVLGLLEALQVIPHGELRSILAAAAQLIARTFDADKVDAFEVDEEHQQLVAVGVSDTPMGRRERALGLDVLPLRHGGRAAYVFNTCQPFIDGHADQDPEELLAISRDLGVRSTLAVPLGIPHDGGGVLMVTSARPDAFSSNQLRLLSFVARWLELIVVRMTETHGD